MKKLLLVIAAFFALVQFTPPPVGQANPAKPAKSQSGFVITETETQSLIETKPDSQPQAEAEHVPEVKCLVFTAGWCQPCQALKSRLRSIAPRGWKTADYGSKEGAHFVLVDYDSQQDLAATYQVKSLPTSVFLVDGQEAHRTVGCVDVDAEFVRVYEATKQHKMTAFGDGTPVRTVVHASSHATVRTLRFAGSAIRHAGYRITHPFGGRFRRCK